ncbi:hypothetical protein KAU11_11095, partial [Candidatus Babeliales bacterium]|nr:hypothetical protein [Candidatus Babeliales bacterium]
ETAKKISIEIQMSVFSQIQEIQPKEIQEEESQIEKDELTQSAELSSPVTGEELKKSSKKDTYREPIR